MRRVLVLLLLFHFVLIFAAEARKRRPAARQTTTRKSAAVRKTAAKTARKPLRAKRTTRKVRVYRGPWKEPTFAKSADDDDLDGEDLEVRRAAVAALGAYNGTIVVTEAATGRILSIVNQKLALSGGYQPCSTVKLVTSLAALQESLIPQVGPSRLTRKAQAGLTYALAHSPNGYFALLGKKLGFDRVVDYARELGLGEKAAWGLDEEQPGTLPPAPPREGVGMMTSFGSGIALTPLQLAALIGAIANDGTLYYLQYPRSSREAAAFVPRVKRELSVAGWLDPVKMGMRAAVEQGTGRRAAYEIDEPIHGKTGTCTDFAKGAHMGWFGSFNDIGRRKLVVVVMLTGARGVSGSVASGIAGKVYAELARRDYELRAASYSPSPGS